MIGKKIIALGFRVSLAVSCLHMMVLGTPNAQGQTLDSVLNNAKVQMDDTVEQTRIELDGVRLPTAKPDLLDNVMVDYNDSSTRLNVLATMTTPDATTIMVTPVDIGAVNAIEKAIRTSNLGLNPEIRGSAVKVSIPAVTGEGRQQLLQSAKDRGESGRTAVRRILSEASAALKKLLASRGISASEEKNGRQRLQGFADGAVARIEEFIRQKEVELYPN